MEEKRKDLEAERQKRVIARIVEELSASSPDFYYQSTSVIAAQIETYVSQGGGGLNQDDRALLKGLSKRDIEIVLSLH